MSAMRKLKIGLAAVMCTPFRGDKESQYAGAGLSLEEMSEELHFELHIIQKGCYTLSDAEAACAELREWGADFVLLQTASFAHGSFVYPFAQLPAFLGIWAVPEGKPAEGGGLPFNSFTSANLYNSILKTRLPDYRKPVKWFFGSPDSLNFQTRLRVTVQSLSALVNLRGRRVGLVGGVASGFDNLTVDEEALRQRLGVGVTAVEFDELTAVMERVGAARQRHASQALRGSATEFQSDQEPYLERAGRVSAALELLADERKLDAVALSCWPRFQDDLHIAVCSVVGQLNGQGLITACEGDVASAVGMLTLHYLSFAQTVTLMDLVTIDPADDSLLLWHCGPTAPQLADSQGTRMGSLYLFDGYGERMGLANDLVLRPGQATVLGFSPDFSRLLILDGIIDNRKPSYRGSRGWLTQPRINCTPVSALDAAETILASGFQHHYPLGYGDLAAAGIELAAWLGLSVIPLRRSTAYLTPQDGENLC